MDDCCIRETYLPQSICGLLGLSVEGLKYKEYLVARGPP